MRLRVVFTCAALAASTAQAHAQEGGVGGILHGNDGAGGEDNSATVTGENSTASAGDGGDNTAAPDGGTATGGADGEGGVVSPNTGTNGNAAN